MLVTRLFHIVAVFFLALSFTLLAEPLNQFQIIGSHNSYKKPLFPQVQEWLDKQHPELSKQISYSHLTLQKQLDLGLRQLEIDVLADPQGGHYAHPWVETLLQTTLYSEAERQVLLQAGFKVLHIPGLDVSSNCLTFSECLNRLRQWSDSHPDHFPIMILLNAKENQPDFVRQPAPVAFNDEQYVALDKAIIKGLGRSKLFTPDDLRQQASTLRNAVVHQGWPDVSELRGKFICLFDANPAQAELYRHNHPSLRSRSMFASYPAADDEAAILVINDPIEQQQQIRKWVGQGFLVRTRADADFKANAEQRAAQFNAAKSSGAQWISTDFYPGSPQLIHSDFHSYDVRFKAPQQREGMNEWLRSNPVFPFTH